MSRLPSPRRTIRAALVAVALATTAAMPTAHADTRYDLSTDMDRFKQKMEMLKADIGQFRSALKDADAIVKYYDVMLANFESFRSRTTSLSQICLKRRQTYEELKREGSPFLPRAARLLQRCDTDFPEFERALKVFETRLGEIERNTRDIEREAKRLEGHINDTETELRVREDQKKLMDSLDKGSRDIQNFIQSSSGGLTN